jgi:FkbM family methyltransferase
LLLAPVVFFQGGGLPLGRSMRQLQPLTAGQWAQAFGPSSLLPASAVGRVVYSAPLSAPAAATPAAASGEAAAALAAAAKKSLHARAVARVARPLRVFRLAPGEEQSIAAPLGAAWPGPPPDPFPATMLAYGRASWLGLQPHEEYFLQPELIFDRTRNFPRIELDNGEQMPLYPLGYIDADTGAVTQWRVGDGPIVSYVVQNEQANFEALRLATRSCVPASPRAEGPRLVLDVGANHGLFGFLALARGCEVEFYDPQRYCADILGKTLASQAPEAAARGRVFAVPVGLPGLAFNAAYGEFCAGRYSVNDGQHDLPFRPERGHEWGESYQPFPGFRGAPQDLREVRSVTLDDAISGRRIAFLKVDVEGYESDVVASGLASFEQGLVDVFVVEVSPSMWVISGWDIGDKAAPFLALLDAGYRCAILRGRKALADPAEAFRGPGGALGSLDKAALLRHIQLMAAGQHEHGCSKQCDYLFVSERILQEDTQLL